MAGKRTRRGAALLAFGVLLLAFAGGWFVHNLREDAEAGRAAEDILQRLETESPVTPEGDAAPLYVVDGERYCGTVIIESIGVTLPVCDGWDYARLRKAPCRYSGSVEGGDIIIAAHNYKSHFGRLGELQPGNTVRFADPAGREYRYRVAEVTLVDGTAVEDMKSGDWDFTLFTCTKGREMRVAVRCIREE